MYITNITMETITIPRVKTSDHEWKNAHVYSKNKLNNRTHVHCQYHSHELFDRQAVQQLLCGLLY